jgi:putative transposase
MTVLAQRKQIVEWIDQAQADGARLAPACAQAGISVRTRQRWARAGVIHEDQRPSAVRPVPAHALTQEERAAIVAVINTPEHASLPPSQIVPRLADIGQYLGSESTFYRVMKAHQQQHHRGRAKAPQRRPISRHIAVAPGQIWCWDITYLPSTVKGQFFYLYLVHDLYSRKIIGWEVHESESGELAKTLIQRCYLAEKQITQAHSIVLHSDNGAPMKCATLLATLQQLGIAPSRSRPGVSDDNAFVEALFRTCKYRPGYPAGGLADVVAWRQWVHTFVQWYNTEHRHSALRFVTPEQKHTRQDIALLARRDRLYHQARQRHPRRWSKHTRNWKPIDAVHLNPDRSKTVPLSVAAS